MVTSQRHFRSFFINCPRFIIKYDPSCKSCCTHSLTHTYTHTDTQTLPCKSIEPSLKRSDLWELVMMRTQSSCSAGRRQLLRPRSIMTDWLQVVYLIGKNYV